MIELGKFMELTEDYMNIPKIGTTHVTVREFNLHFAAAILTWLFTLFLFSSKLVCAATSKKSDYDRFGNPKPGMMAKLVPILFKTSYDSNGVPNGFIYRNTAFMRTNWWFYLVSCFGFGFCFKVYDIYSEI